MVVGANFRFGNRAAGDVATLRETGAIYGFEAEGIALDGGPQVWSSTYVRTCLATGDVAGAAEALGRPYAVRGAVVRGDQRGRELGYPTANVPTSTLTAAPADGVYAGWLRRLDTGETFPAAISVGTNPTFDGQRERRVESYVLDRTDLELYGVEVEVSFVERLRGMVAFGSVEELVEQMRDDVDRARELLGATRDPAGRRRRGPPGHRDLVPPPRPDLLRARAAGPRAAGGPGAADRSVPARRRRGRHRGRGSWSPGSPTSSRSARRRSRPCCCWPRPGTPSPRCTPRRSSPGPWPAPSGACARCCR